MQRKEQPQGVCTAAPARVEGFFRREGANILIEKPSY